MGQPAARIGDFHACPMVTGLVPHVGGPVAMGSANVITGGMPQARVGDMAVCVGPPDVIAKGSSGVFVNGMAAARVGDLTAHGGAIVVGLPTVLIGEMGGGAGGGASPGAAGVSLAYAAFEAQVKVLLDAAKHGVPFCEVCFKAAQAKLNTALLKKAPSKTAAPSPKPKPPSALPPKKPPAPGVVCELKAMKLTCAHGRSVGADGKLMVVPNSLAAMGDAISGALSMKGGCGDHAAWAVTGGESHRGKGASFSFKANSATGAVGLVSLRAASPAIYHVEGDACHGGPVSYEVHAYPPGKVGLELDITDVKEKIVKALSHLPIEKERLREFESQWFIGKTGYEGRWAEDPGSWQAYYAQSVTGGFDPLAGLSYKGPIYPPTLVPDWIGKYVRAGLFFKVELGFKVQANLVRKYWPHSRRTDWSTRQVSAGGEATGTLSVELALVDPDVISASVAGKTGVGLTGTLQQSEELTAELKVAFEGVEGIISLEAAFGIIHYNRSFQLLGESEAAVEWSLEPKAGDGGAG